MAKKSRTKKTAQTQPAKVHRYSAETEAKSDKYSTRKRWVLAGITVTGVVLVVGALLFWLISWLIGLIF